MIRDLLVLIEQVRRIAFLLVFLRRLLCNQHLYTLCSRGINIVYRVSTEVMKTVSLSMFHDFNEICRLYTHFNGESTLCSQYREINFHCIFCCLE